ncbi:hypothetical protein SRHO_G00103380 [Serrasalmus rhombeus]
MCSYCHTFIPSYAEKEGPLREIIPTESTNTTRLQWTEQAEEAFTQLKIALQNMPALGTPDPTKPFVQMVDAKGIYMTAVAAAEKALVASRDIVGHGPLTLKVPHSVHNILQDQRVAHLSTQRWLRYHTALLDLPIVTVCHCTALNPASLLPTPEDGEPHDCQLLLLHACTPRIDLKNEPLPNAELELFVDGSASKDEMGINRVAYAVVSATDILHTQSLPSSYSAQAAELIALTKGCEFAEGKMFTVWTDSRYTWGVAHDFGYMWKQRNFLTSSGTKIKHHKFINELLSALLLPSQIAVVKCAAHTSADDPVSKGNAFADRVAKHTACTDPIAATQIPVTDQEKPTLQDIQSSATLAERAQWSKSGCVKQNKVKAVLPQAADQPFHNHKPGDWVLIRDLRRWRLNQPKWRAPHQVILVTHTAVKVEGRGT